MSLFDRIVGDARTTLESVAHAVRQQGAGVPGLAPKLAHAAKRQVTRTGLVTQAGWAPEARPAERARQAAHLARRGKATS